MSLISFPTDRVRQGADRVAKATAYRLKAAALGRLMEEEADVEKSRAYLMHALSLIQLAENEECLADVT